MSRSVFQFPSSMALLLKSIVISFQKKLKMNIPSTPIYNFAKVMMQIKKLYKINKFDVSVHYKINS